jgi:hypothetical protein
MSGFRPSVIASVVLGLMTRMVRFVRAVGSMIAAGVPKCLKTGGLGGLGIADGCFEQQEKMETMRTF